MRQFWGGLLLIVMGLVPAGAPRAQGAPFETITLQAGPTLNVNRETLHTYWQPKVGFALNLRMPFYFGVAEWGSGLHRYTAERTQLTDFVSVPIYLGWGVRTEVLDRLEASLMGHIGNYVMLFGESAAGRSVENELMLGTQARLRLRIAGPWALTLAGSYHRVFTHVRIDLWHITFGLSRRFHTPGWLESFLR